MKRFWVIQHEKPIVLRDGIYNCKYCSNKSDKNGYVKMENGLYYTSFDNKTWLKAYPKNIYYLPNNVSTFIQIFLMLIYINILKIILSQKF
jgi:hypothetical protein